ncbi:MAG: hypothetical protein E7238_05170 [Sarcina sp.]|nr:hypothetical protein [Sarcina sp.]
MDRKQHITAFYLETLLMIVVFISIILVLTRVFGGARLQSVEAERLTTSVTLAQNTAEAVSASKSAEDLLALMDRGGNARLSTDEKTGRTLVTAAYDHDLQPVALRDGSPAAPGALLVEAEWIPAGQDGGLTDCHIRVSAADTGAEIYSLDTSVYIPQQ